MRLEFSVIGFVEFACYAIIFGFFWRIAAAHLANNDNSVGKAMAFIF